MFWGTKPVYFKGFAVLIGNHPIIHPAVRESHWTRCRFQIILIPVRAHPLYSIQHDMDIARLKQSSQLILQTDRVHISQNFLRIQLVSISQGLMLNTGCRQMTHPKMHSSLLVVIRYPSLVRKQRIPYTGVRRRRCGDSPCGNKFLFRRLLFIRRCLTILDQDRDRTKS